MFDFKTRHDYSTDSHVPMNGIGCRTHIYNVVVM